MLRCAPQSSLTLRACEFNWSIQHDDRLKLSLGSLPVPTALSRELLRRETRSQMADQSPGGDTPNFARNAASTTTRSALRSEEHTSELQSQSNLVCRLLLEKKKKHKKKHKT